MKRTYEWNYLKPVTDGYNTSAADISAQYTIKK
jgi:hypothetical protein